MRPLPVGIDSFEKLIQENYYYIDKTLLIKELLELKGEVNLFTRPRRFGKTLNMDMLRTFFEKTTEDTSVYFRDKKIWSCGESYLAHHRKYPVIFLSFKDVNWLKYYECRGRIYFTDGVLSCYFSYIKVCKTKEF